MHFEIEQKFRCEDLVRVCEGLLALGAEIGDAVEQSDCYYKHPVRDFAATDEAFRLRRVGMRNYMTYKGPKIDATTKSRLEEEVRLADGETAHHSCGEILHHLGFMPVATVAKQRQTLDLVHDGVSIEAALDDVQDLGMFVELEASVVGDDASIRDEAKRALAAVAAKLGLGEPERRSYLELLLSRATKP